MNVAISSDASVLNGLGSAVANEALQAVRLWCTEAMTKYNWVAEYASDTTNPAGITGYSFRTADSDNADALMGTCGIAAETTTAAGWCMVWVRGRVNAESSTVGPNVDSGAAIAIGDDLTIGATAGRAIEFTGTAYNTRLVGRCESTPSSNTASVTLYPHPRFA